MRYPVAEAVSTHQILSPTLEAGSIPDIEAN